MNVRTKFEVRSFTPVLPVPGIIGGTFKTLGRPWIRRSKLSMVIDFSANRQRVCDFLLVLHSNLGPILHHLGDSTLAFLCS